MPMIAIADTAEEMRQELLKYAQWERDKEALAKESSTTNFFRTRAAARYHLWKNHVHFLETLTIMPKEPVVTSDDKTD